MTNCRAALHWSLAIASVLFGVAATDPGADVPHVGNRAPLQLAGGVHAKKKLVDSDADVDVFAPSSTRSKSPSSATSSQRARRFWSHYHGARPEKKAKPLERER